MDQRRIWFYLALIVLLLTSFLLVTGSALLTIPLDDSNTLPLGTFISWIGIISLPFSIYWGVKELRSPTTNIYKYLAILLRVMLVLAILWMPISCLLAGNFSFSFSEKDTFQGGQLAMSWFWRLSFGLVLGPILVLIVYWISILRKRNK